MMPPDRLNNNEVKHRQADHPPVNSRRPADESDWKRSGKRRSAGRCRTLEIQRKERLRNRQGLSDRLVQRVKNRRVRKQRTAGVVLNPLTEVGVGMLMAVMVGRR